MIDIVSVVRETVRLPIAIKLSPFFSSIAHLAWQLDMLGANGLVLFNRFYQPDIDPEALEAVPRAKLSESGELLLRLRWLAILFGRLRASLAVSGGIHTAIDAVKAIMAGADAVQIVSALLLNGPDHLRVVRAGVTRWMEEHEYASLGAMRGSMSLARCSSAETFERATYLRILQSWRGAGGSPVRA